MLKQRLPCAVDASSTVRNDLYVDAIVMQNRICRPATLQLWAQWHALSMYYPRLLTLAIERQVDDHAKRILTQILAGELGLDGRSRPHSEHCKDLFQTLFEVEPGDYYARSTQAMLESIEAQLSVATGAEAMGIIYAFEDITEDSIEVLKDILRRSVHSKMLLHPYIRVHDDVILEGRDGLEAWVIEKGSQQLEGRIQEAYTGTLNKFEDFWRTQYQALLRNNKLFR